MQRSMVVNLPSRSRILKTPLYQVRYRVSGEYGESIRRNLVPKKPLLQIVYIEEGDFTRNHDPYHS